MKFKFFMYLGLSLLTNLCFADQVLYKCKGDKSFVFYKNMNNQNNYNGWYEVIGMKCNSNIATLNVACNNGQLNAVDNDGILTTNVVNGVNCTSFQLNFPQSNMI